jgi:CheY-like chemotaxis protein
VNLKIEISDTGIGIPKEQQETIFLAFTQQDNQNVVFGGTGLGLTICKRLSELMHGSISVDSRLGQGSRFEFCLNNVEVIEDVADVAEKSVLSLTVIAFQPARILVVDDIQLNRQLISSYLAEFRDLTLIEAESGAQALSLIARQVFDLILMDRRLPDEDGDKVCEKIRALPAYATTPIIMISASVLNAQEKTRPTFYNLQLNKPLNKSDFLAALQSFLPVDKNAVARMQPMREKSKALFEETLPPEQLPELWDILCADYQQQITELANSGGFEIDVFIDTAEQLLEIANQYHYRPLFEWATQLKRQAELFDLTMLPKTLTRFDGLVEKLKTTVL